MIEFILSFRNFFFFLFSLYALLNVHPNPAIHRLATTVKEARATTRRDSPFQGTWKVNPWYLESLFSSSTFLY